MSRQKQKTKKPITQGVITGRRLWLFRMTALIVLPVLLLAAAEIALRIVGCGFSPEAMIQRRIDNRNVFCDNVKFGWQFFPRHIARESEPFIFPVEKPDNTYRIFILGASAAQGTPDPAYSFARILEQMLHDQYPSLSFEVINTAMTAINSHVVLQIAEDCARCDPDLFIVYLGNNEVIGPYGGGNGYGLPRANLPAIRMVIAFKATRLGQLLARLADSVGAERNTPNVWLGLEMFLNHQVRPHTPLLEAIYRNFQRNLEDIRRITLKNRSKIIFCTVGSNLKDNPPFASLHRPNLSPTDKKEWNSLYEQGIEFELKGNYTDAVERYLKAAKIDDHYADLQFRSGRCYWAASKYEEARERFIRARERDTLRFRADVRINHIIRSVAAGREAEGIYLTDATKALERNSPHATPGQELFYDHVHLNFKGNYILAKAVFEQVEKILPSKMTEIHEDDTHPTLTEDQCARALAYTGWDRYRIADQILNDLIKHPPFTNQLYHQERVAHMEQKIEDLKIYLAPDALENIALAYRQAIEQSPSDWRLRWKYGKFLTEGLKDYQAATEQGRLLRKHSPHSYLVNTALGAVARGLGDIDEVVAQYEQAIRIKPTCVDAHYYLAWAYHQQGKMDKSIEFYSKTLRLQPIHVQAYNDLVEILYREGRIDEGIEVCRKALRVAPDSAILHCNLGIMLIEKGNRTEALKALNTALRIDPNSQKIQQVLEAILQKGQ